ncbi:MAG: hypothetical protein OXR68_02950 [Alphaproteobacteria bacterium]|nr:hypothetical protein [Alphaproteobacteria bacterium]
MGDILLHEAEQINFSQQQHVFSEGDKAQIDSWWQEFTSDKPYMFNGQLLACKKAILTDSSKIGIDWYLTNYAHYLLRFKEGSTITPARAMYCAVILMTTSGKIVVGKMSNATSLPTRLQLPGGNLELFENSTLSMQNCFDSACMELKEEVGITLQPEELALWSVKTGGDFDDVGLFFVAQKRVSEDFITSAFNQHISALKQANEKPELTHIYFVDKSDDLNVYADTWVDYLPVVMEKFF